MSTIFIIHGSDDGPQEHWFPWLKQELEIAGHKVLAPQFPCENNHVLSAWFDVLVQYEKYINSETIFVGHSRGCAFIWRVLEKLKTPIHGAFFVGGFSQYLWYPKKNNKPDTFYETKFHWEKIRSMVRHVKVYQSTNDEYIPMAIGKEIANSFGVPITVVQNAGHFCDRHGYITFPLLLEDIKKIIKLKK